MSDLTTIHLHEIFHDADQLATLHRIQRERLEERAITAGKRPAGMRLSCPDPIRRVKGSLDPFWTLTLDEGLAERGFMAEDLLEVALFHGAHPVLGGKQYEAQKSLRWHRAGVTAFDWVAIDVDGADRVVSCKSVTSDKKPSAANIAQERRMCALAGYPAGGVFEIWMVNVSTLRATGPYVYELEQHHIDEALGELAGVDLAYTYFTNLDDPTRSPQWNDPAAWLDLFGLTSTSDAFWYKPTDASGKIEARVRAERRAVAAAKAAKSDADALTDRIYQFVDEQLAAAAAAGEPIKSIVAYAGDELVSYGRKSNGAKHTVAKPFRDERAA